MNSPNETRNLHLTSTHTDTVSEQILLMAEFHSNHVSYGNNNLCGDDALVHSKKGGN